MEVYEIKLKIYAIKDISSRNSLNFVSELIDKTFLKNSELSGFHKTNTFKFYTHDNMMPIEESRVYNAGNIYTVRIRTVDYKLVEHFDKYLVNEYTDSLKALTLEKRVIPKKYIDRIYTVTPAVAKFDNGYWKGNESLEVYERRLKENIIKKYNEFFDAKIKEDFEFFTFMKFDNHKPVSIEYKNIKLLGDKITLNISENDRAQDIAYFVLGTGILEMNSRGLGFVNYKYL